MSNNWLERARARIRNKENGQIANSMSKENLLSRWGRTYDNAHSGEYGYTTLSKRFDNLYKKALDYYNNDAYKGFYDTYSGGVKTKGYDANAGSLYRDLEKQSKDANEGIDELLAELDQYSRYYNEDAVKYVRDLITQRQGSYNDLLKSAGEYRDQFAQWKDEDDYNADVWQGKFAEAYNAGKYDEAEALLMERGKTLQEKYGAQLINNEEYKELLKYEEAIKNAKENNEYKPFWDAVNAGDLDSAEAFLEDKASKDGERYNNNTFVKLDNAVNDIYTTISNGMQEKFGISLPGSGKSNTYTSESLEEYRGILNKLKEEEAYKQNNSNYLELMQNEDFGANSAYKTTKNGEEKLNYLAMLLNGGKPTYSSTGYGDLIYDVINGNEDAYNLLYNKTAGQQGAEAIAFGAVPLDHLTQLEDDEKKIFNYIYATEGKDAAYEYITHLEDKYLYSRMRDDLEKRMAESAKVDPIGTSIASVVFSPLKGMSYAMQAGDYFSDGEMTKDAPYNSMLYGSNAARSTVSADIEEKWGKAGSFAYDVGMSMGDFLTSTAVSGGNPTIAGIIMGTGAAADTTLAGVDRGLDSTRAFVTGTIAGLAEFFTEKMGVDNLLDKKLLSKSKLNYILKNAIAEGAEEGATDLINWAVDDLYDLISGQNMSEWKAAIAEYEKQGYSTATAVGKALGDRAIQLGTDIAAGAASGGVMGGGGAIMQTFAEGKEGKKYKSDPAALIDEALRIDPKNELALSLQQKLADGKKISSVELGRLSRIDSENVAEALKKGDEGIKARETSAREDVKKGIENKIAGKIERNATNDKTISSLAETITKAALGEEVSNAEIRRLSKNAAGIAALNNELGLQKKGEKLKVGDSVSAIREAISSKQSSKTKLSTNNILATVAALADMDEAAERGLYTSYASDVRNGREVTPEAYAAAYANAMNDGKKGVDIADVKARYADVLSESSVTMAYRSGENAAKIKAGEESTSEPTENAVTTANLEGIKEATAIRIKDANNLMKGGQRGTSLLEQRLNAAMQEQIDGGNVRDRSGADAFSKSYSAEFLSYYVAGKSGVDIKDVTAESNMLSESERADAYNAGREDAGLSAKKVLQNGENGGIISTDDNSLKEGKNDTKRTDEFRAIQEASRGMSGEEVQSFRNGSEKLDSSKREGLRVAFEKELSASRSGKSAHQSSLVNPKTGKTIDILEGVDGNLFHDIFEIARNYLRNGELVDLHDDYENATCYISSDGLCGFAIENDGNLVSVFNLGEGGFLDTIAQYVKDKGATHLDCYNSAVQPLTLMYERKLGFKTASIMDYNMEYDHDNIAENHGMPKVAFMVNVEADVETREFNKDQYDEAVEYQRSFIDSKASNSNTQRAKENTIDPKRIVYSTDSAKAYDAIPREKLSAKQKRVADVAQQIGLKVIFATTVNKEGVEVDGFIAKNGDIYINPNRNVSPMEFVFKHELAHFAERSGQKYQDFKNLVRETKTFKKWLADKGMTERAYVSQIVGERAAIGQKIDEPSATAEIMANFVGDMLFSDQGTWAEDLSRELNPKQRKTVQDFVRDFFKWIKSLFVGEAGKAKVEVHKIEKAFGAAFRAAAESSAGTNGERFSFQGYAKDGKGKYKSNFPKGTPKSAKAKVILDYIKNVWSKKPIALQINENGKTRTIQAQFDPTYSEDTRFKSDASKLMGGNRHGSASDQRVTLDLADDYYQLATESTYNYSKEETGKDNPTHKDVKKWHYFINDIYFAEYDSDNYVPYRVTINIKEKADGTFVYSFSAENQERLNTPQTLHAVVSGNKIPANVQPSDISISNSGEKNNSQNAQNFDEQTEQFSYTPQDEKVASVFEQLRSGQISLNEAERILKTPKGDTPVSIASLKPEDMATTPKLDKKTKGNAGDGDSKFADSIQTSKLFKDDLKAELKDDIFVKHYASITNKETLAEAVKALNNGGEAYVKEWFAKKAVRMDTIDTMVGFILLKRYQDVGDYASAAAVAQKVREVGTLSGQRVQAFSIIGRFDPDMMQVYAQKELTKAWEMAIQSRGEAWGKKNAERFKLTDEDISYIRDNILYAAKLPENSRERAVVLAQISTFLQNKLPPVKGQSFKSWQRISMLLNPKTQIRNVLGNAMMSPVFIASDWFATPLDKLISTKTGVRTTGLTGLHGNKANIKAAMKGLYESYDDWKRHINTKAAEQNRFEVGQGKSFDETKWGRIARMMNSFDRFTSFLLDAGDRPFYEAWFTNSLNEQMRLNKVSEPTADMVQIAIDEALSRTWQDENRMTKFVSGLKNAMNVLSIGGYGVGDVLIKFTKTPANLTKAIYDFSPAAIASIAPQAVQLNRAIKNGTVTSAMQKKFVNTVGKMAAGTMLYIIFAALYAAGHIRGSSDEDKDVAAFEKYVQGIPEYAIKIGGKWFSYDWAQPIGAVPAIIADLMESHEQGAGVATSVYEAIKAGGEVLFNQSFMTSLQTLFAADSFVEGALDLILGEITVPVPTFFSQIANVFDENRRVTYDGTSEIKSALNRALMKIPGIRNLLEKEIDVLGRDVKNSQKNWFNAFFNPANVYTDTSTKVTDHAYAIYESTGDQSAIPKKAPYSVKLQGQTIRLDILQRAQYQRTMGEVASDLVENLLKNDIYMAMTDVEKLAVLKQVYSYAEAEAKSQLDWADDYKVINGIANYVTEQAFNKMSDEEKIKIVDDYIFSSYEGMDDIESEVGKTNYLINKKTSEMVLDATLRGDIDKAIELIDGIQERVDTYGWSDEDAKSEVAERKTSVKSTLTRYWKEAYLHAYYKHEYEEQERIIDILTNVGLYGERRDVEETVEKWIESYEEE